jgi:nucleotide-binding universal stress UspA family protein
VVDLLDIDSQVVILALINNFSNWKFNKSISQQVNMKNFLLPLDFTDTTGHTLDWARLLTRTFNAKLTLVHVYEPVVADTTVPNLGDPGVGATAALDLEPLAAQRIAALVDQLAAEGLDVQGEMLIGHPEDGILEAAKRFISDLIITGRSDVSTFFDRLAGSAANDIARDAICPVLLVPAVDPTRQVVKAPAIRTVAYVMQPKTTQDLVSKEAGPLATAFGAELKVLMPDAIDNLSGDVLVMHRYEQGALDGLFGADKAARFLTDTGVPVLVYHDAK